MDYLTAQYPPHFINSILSLTHEQLQVALSYIEAHRPEFEAEYQTVLQEAEALQKYWETQSELYRTLVKSRNKWVILDYS